ncbi:MAG: cytochrome bc complex cytochrome b subunit [Gammaproteobacteria bacterium]
MKKFADWLDLRLPYRAFLKKNLTQYYVPKNLNIWYVFGSIALIVLLNQLITGIWLTMFYTPTPENAFGSIEYIMRDVNYGWLIRYMHTTGSNAFFIIIYLHIFRSLLYGSHKSPRELVWIFGVTLYLLLIIEAFTGYLLPWGQMSYWGAQAIIHLFDTIPMIGEDFANWLRGDYSISGITLSRFFALHIILIPLFLLFFTYLHLTALRRVGSNNPTGIEMKNKYAEGITFHPYYTMKDLLAAVIFFMLFASVIFFAPTLGGLFITQDNFIPANALQTPVNIHPLWYLSPYYTILRGIPYKFLGIITFFASLFILYLLPWLDRSKVRSIRYRGLFSKVALFIFVLSFIGLLVLGLISLTPTRLLIIRILTLLYFLFFLLMPFYTRFEKTKPTPENTL